MMVVVFGNIKIDVPREGSSFTMASNVRFTPQGEALAGYTLTGNKEGWRATSFAKDILIRAGTSDSYLGYIGVEYVKEKSGRLTLRALILYFPYAGKRKIEFRFHEPIQLEREGLNSVTIRWDETAGKWVAIIGEKSVEVEVTVESPEGGDKIINELQKVEAIHVGYEKLGFLSIKVGSDTVSYPIVDTDEDVKITYAPDEEKYLEKEKTQAQQPVSSLTQQPKTTQSQVLTVIPRPQDVNYRKKASPFFKKISEITGEAYKWFSRHFDIRFSLLRGSGLYPLVKKTFSEPVSQVFYQYVTREATTSALFFTPEMVKDLISPFAEYTYDPTSGRVSIKKWKSNVIDEIKKKVERGYKSGEVALSTDGVTMSAFYTVEDGKVILRDIKFESEKGGATITVNEAVVDIKKETVISSREVRHTYRPLGGIEVSFLPREELTLYSAEWRNYVFSLSLWGSSGLAPLLYYCPDCPRNKYFVKLYPYGFTTLAGNLKYIFPDGKKIGISPYGELGYRGEFYSSVGANLQYDTGKFSVGLHAKGAYFLSAREFRWSAGVDFCYRNFAIRGGLTSTGLNIFAEARFALPSLIPKKKEKVTQ